MIEAARACLPPNETQTPQGGRIQGLPSRWSRAGAIQAAVQLGTRSGFPDLGGAPPHRHRPRRKRASALCGRRSAGPYAPRGGARTHGPAARS
eukprot:8131303-Alexandrium_andersonii.AAC.1